MSTPTPRTDAAQFIQHDMTDAVSADLARTLERELAIEQERATHYRDEWQKERAKVRVLREACESICEEWGKSHDTPFYAGNKMDALATAALAATEDAT